MNRDDSSRIVRISVMRSACERWNDIAQRDGRWQATRQLLAALCEFLRDSTPGRRRSRYGDAEFDWDRRVDTTSGTVVWRDRLLGVLHSPYQPTEPELFHQMMTALRAQTHCEFRDFIFIDLGSGKGRTLLMAADYPFRRILGIELLPELHKIALENLRKYGSESQKCFALEAICADASDFVFPGEPMILYLFNPLPESGLRSVIAHLEQSLREHPRTMYVIYHNPLLERVLTESPALRKIGGTHQYSMYETVCG
jgi:hypothetical protein